MSLTFPTDASLRPAISLSPGDLTVPQFSFLALLLTLAAISADQLLAPQLYTSSPLWATAACLALVWRKGNREFQRGDLRETFRFTPARALLFVAAHGALVLAARLFLPSLEPALGSQSRLGWALAVLKLSALVPTLLLVSPACWRKIARADSAEAGAALLVLLTFFPGRYLTAFWPFYGQALGRVIFGFSRLFAHGLVYLPSLTPTILGPGLDVTILYSCSGITGVELFDCLFLLIAILDWNLLRKGRALAAYFGGVAVMLLGNAMRIASFVILGNRGFGDVVARVHLSAGWIFFSILFLAYLALVYRKLLVTSR